jgi:hypothetical protein
MGARTDSDATLAELMSHKNGVLESVRCRQILEVKTSQ